MVTDVGSGEYIRFLDVYVDGLTKEEFWMKSVRTGKVVYCRGREGGGIMSTIFGLFIETVVEEGRRWRNFRLKSSIISTRNPLSVLGNSSNRTI